jgi:hypothetical protein
MTWETVFGRLAYAIQTILRRWRQLRLYAYR